MNGEHTYKNNVTGTRVLHGRAADLRRYLLTTARNAGSAFCYEEIVLPTLDRVGRYGGAVKDEDFHRMLKLEPRKESEHGDGQICLAPEGTAQCMELARTLWAHEKDKKVWYELRCFRGDRPQAGRWREFTQIGFEVLNPTDNDTLTELCIELLAAYALDIGRIGLFLDMEVRHDVPDRGHHYYTSGWEIHLPSLGSCSQIAGGGAYANGKGFAIGVDRVVMAALQAETLLPSERKTLHH